VEDPRGATADNPRRPPTRRALNSPSFWSPRKPSVNPGDPLRTRTRPRSRSVSRRPTVGNRRILLPSLACKTPRLRRSGVKAEFSNQVQEKAVQEKAGTERAKTRYGGIESDARRSGMGFPGACVFQRPGENEKQPLSIAIGTQSKPGSLSYNSSVTARTPGKRDALLYERTRPNQRA
jgi:hypothetical protein